MTRVRDQTQAPDRYRNSQKYDKDVEKLSKIVSLYGSDVDGEQDAAFRKAQQFCQSRGWTYKEGMEKLSRREATIAGSPFAGYKYFSEGCVNRAGIAGG